MLYSLCCLIYNMNPAKFNTREVAFLDSDFNGFSWHDVISGFNFKFSTGTFHATDIQATWDLQIWILLQ